MAIAILFGFLFATVLTLGVVPVLYPAERAEAAAGRRLVYSRLPPRPTSDSRQPPPTPGGVPVRWSRAMLEPPPREAPARAGEHVGDYEILDELGRGGMGVVYRARDRRLPREVALKSPWRHLAESRSHRARFLREARAASRLAHPGIVPILETFEHDGVPWIAMQLVDGVDLQSELATKGALPAKTVLRHTEEVATALQFAHERKVLHRDINPKNILITSDGRALLSDFGLARFLESEPPELAATTASSSWSDLTSRGVVLGTPRYMSPEQAMGRELDARSDIFSLGTVIYEMCTGSAAFDGSGPADLLDAILHREPVPVSRFTYEVPPELERIIRKAVAKDPDERYQNVGDLLVDVRALRREVEFKSYSDSHPGVAPPRWRRRAPASTSAVLAVVVAAAAGSGWWMATHRTAPFPDGTPVQVTSAAGLERDPALSPDGGRVAYASDEAGNLDVYVIDARGGTPLRLTDHEASDDSPAWFPDGSEIAYVSTRDGTPSIWKVGQMGGGSTLLVPHAIDPAVSPDGARIAFAAFDSSGIFLRIGVREIGEPGAIALLTGPEDGFWVGAPTWSPDGDTICYSDRTDLWLVDRAGGPPRRLTEQGNADRDPVWSPSGRYVYFSSHRTGAEALWRVDVRTRRLERLTSGAASEGQPTVSANGARLAYASHSTPGDENNLVIVDLASRSELVLDDNSNDIMPDLAPDGSAIVFASNRWGSRYVLWRQPLADGKPSGAPMKLTDQPGNASHPVFSPDGRWVAYYRIHEGRRDIWTVPADGGLPRQITDDAASDLHPAWSPDGTSLAYVSDRESGYQIWIVPMRGGNATGAPHRVTDAVMGVAAPVFAPDGRRIAFIGDVDGRTDVWITDVDGAGSPRAVTHGAGAYRVRWDPTGPLVVCGTWGTTWFSCRLIDPETGEGVGHGGPIELGAAPTAVFDVSLERGVLAFARDAGIGDIWLLDADPHRY
jgi:Tol biopolymer transport system component/serine/threonine protein kinase